ncbi:MAG TPA: mechanosensitive ion channel domain-containing protein [Candidatus Sulfotelmatobacter sp.]|nr:mechanosensitive ion channel domain-containing protein [Candidatus Sulfotelmatobacter sp.]
MEELNATLVALGERLVVAVLVVIVALVALRVGRGAIRRSIAAMAARAEAEAPADAREEGRKRLATVETLARYAWLVFVTVVASLTVLSQLGVDVGPAVTGLGIAGIAIGFGAQQIVRDYFGGTLILLENQYAKGDVVSLAGVTGVVEEFTLRRTVLRDTDGIVHNVPNGAIVVASNRTRVWRRINQDVVIAYGHDVEQAIAVLDDVGQRLAADPAWRDRILEVPRVDRVDRLGDQGVTLKILGTVRAADHLAVAGELRRRLAAAMAASGLDPRPPAPPTATPDPAPPGH